MRTNDEHRTTLAIVAAAMVAMIASNVGGPISDLVMFTCIVAVLIHVVPRRMKSMRLARRHEPGIQILRHLASAGGPMTRLHAGVIESYVESFGGDRSISNRPRRAWRLSDMDRHLDSISRGYDAAEASLLAEHVDMMRRTRVEHPPLAEESFRRVDMTLSDVISNGPGLLGARGSSRLAGLVPQGFPFMRHDAATETPRIRTEAAPSSTTAGPTKHFEPIIEALGECETSEALDVRKRLRETMRPEAIGMLDDDIRLEAEAAARDLGELAQDFLRSRARTRSAALDGDFVRIAEGLANRMDDLSARQSSREADGFVERARFIAQRHGITAPNQLDIH